jgi:hypothetical protein
MKESRIGLFCFDSPKSQPITLQLSEPNVLSYLNLESTRAQQGDALVIYYQDYQGSSGTSRKSDEIWIHYQNYQGSSLIGKIGNIWK